jgi:site-specific DNA-methyltransferase (adenine-specific)
MVLMNKIDVNLGEHYSKLTVLQETENRNSRGEILYLCLCDCGEKTFATGHSLASGSRKSCGCLSKQHFFKCKPSTEGLTHKEPLLHHVWHGMKSRCYDFKNPKYKNYGKVGIRVCDEWLLSFRRFIDWAKSSGYSDNLSLDRIDNDGDYEPKNCRWATSKQQANNRSSNRPRLIDLSSLPIPVQIGTVTLYNCDCLELMKCYPNKYFDLSDVDPPYGMGGRWTSTGSSGFTLKPNEVEKLNNWDFIPGKDYFDELKRVSKDYMVWGGNYFAKYLHDTNSILIWDKQQRGFTLADGEMCWTSHTDRPLRIINCGQSIRAADKKNIGGRWHPTQKPLYLYRRVLEMYAKPGWKILDTHLGSGTHALACLDLGYELTACEIDKEYFDEAVKRIREYLSSHERIFIPPKVKLTEEGLF